MTRQKRRRSRRRRNLSTLHRWLGVACIAFLVLLSVTGIALNHSDDLDLDGRHVQSSWLLDWYGVETPAVGPSFIAAGKRVSLLGRRLYLDAQEFARDVDDLVGAVETESYVLVATSNEFLILLPGGTLVERIDAGSFLPGPVSALGTIPDAVVLESGGALFETDENLLAVAPCAEAQSGDIRWSIQSPVPRSLLSELQEEYRGRGVTLERLFLDIHSGKILARAGPLLLDVVGVLLLFLSFLGVYTWSARPRRVDGNKRSKTTRR